MNHLAHALFSPPEPEVQVGNIMADMIRPVAPDTLPPGIWKGIRLHRKLDRFFDGHKAIRAAREHLSPERRRYAPVLLDIYFDFFLADRWHHTRLPQIEDFSEECCRKMSIHLDQLPLHYPNAIRHMVDRRWMAHYANPDYLGRVISGLHRRARPGNPLAGAEDEYQGREGLFAPAFAQVLKALLLEFETDPAPADALLKG